MIKSNSLIAAGGRKWEKYGKTRIYFNSIREKSQEMGFNFSVSEINEIKIYFDVDSNSWHMSGTDSNEIKNFVKKYINEIEAAISTGIPDKTQKTSPSRIKINTGSKNIGDEISGQKITSLGKPWTQFVRDDEACCYGLEPGRNYHISMQYAYFN